MLRRTSLCTNRLFHVILSVLECSECICSSSVYCNADIVISLSLSFNSYDERQDNETVFTDSEEVSLPTDCAMSGKTKRCIQRSRDFRVVPRPVAGGVLRRQRAVVPAQYDTVVGIDAPTSEPLHNNDCTMGATMQSLIRWSELTSHSRCPCRTRARSSTSSFGCPHSPHTREVSQPGSR